jgi:DHA2 family multidrug resistance protein
MTASTPITPILTYSPAFDRVVKLMLVVMVSLVTAMEFLTSYAVGVALPDIQGDLSASFDEGSWIITTYTTCFLVGLALSNWLTARVGYRRYMIGAVTTFMASSICCGLSDTLTTLLIFRGVMGFAGGNFLVRGQAAIYLTHTGKARLQALIFYAFTVVALARTFAPAIGGYLTEWYSWRHIFFLNVPLSLAALVLLGFFLPDVKAKVEKPRLDIVGLLLLVGWVAPLQIVLSRGERDDWFADPFICTLAAAAVCCGLLFLWWELHLQNTFQPIISYRVYRSRNFVVGSFLVVIIGMMLYGQLYFVPQFLRGVQQHSAWETGLLQTWNAAAFTVGLFLGAIVMTWIGQRAALAVGAAIFALGMYFWSIRLTPWVPDQQLYLPLVLTGFGAGWGIGPISTLINSQIPNPLLGEAMELYLFQRQLGGSWGIAILTILVDRRRTFWSSRLGESLDNYSVFVRDALHDGSTQFRLSGIPDAQSHAAALGLLHARLNLQSIVNAFDDTFRYQAALGVVALLIVVLFTRARPLDSARRWVLHVVQTVR